MNKILKNLRIFSLFLLCLQIIYTGNQLSPDVKSFKDIWRYCKEWEEGKL